MKRKIRVNVKNKIHRNLSTPELCLAGEKKIKKPRRKSHFLFKILKALRTMERKEEKKNNFF